MPTIKEMRELKLLWRSITGYQSDPPWYKLTEAMRETGLLSDDPVLNYQNVSRVSRLQRDLPRTGVPLKQVLVYYLQIEESIKNLNGRLMSGKEINELLKVQGLDLHPTTRCNWFKDLGGFSAKRMYNTDQVSFVLYRAAVYKAKKKL